MALRCTSCHVVIGDSTDNVAWWDRDDDGKWAARCLACESLRNPPWEWRLELEPASWTRMDGKIVYRMHQEKELAI